MNKKAILLGTYEDPEHAALARERVARHLGNPTIPLNFPARRLTPASVEEVREAAKSRRREWVERMGPTSGLSQALPNPETGYWGVTRKSDGRFAAGVWIGNQRIAAGVWRTAREAAIARDRTVLFLGRELPLNEPHESRRLGAAPPKELSRATRAEQERATKSSPYMGVSRDRTTATWSADINVSGVRHHLGRYEREEDAAMAVDQATLALRPEISPPNFPRRKLSPATPEELRKRAHAAVKSTRTSQYNGVSFVPTRKVHPWCAMAPGHIPVGHWSSEKEAAIAWDRAVLFLGLDVPLNLPKQSRALGAASPVELKCEAHEDYKQTTSSRYHGVYRSRTDRKWVAQIAHRGEMRILGRYDSEDAAAQVYDEAARELHGVNAKVALMVNERARSSTRRRR